MAQRATPPDALDFFPTPPWATRALAECVLPKLGISLADAVVWEPASGEGHMVHVLAEYAGETWASDVHHYGPGQRVGSFVGAGPDVIERPAARIDWIITNPPFALAEDFALRAIEEAEIGAALLVRSVWAEGGGRYERIFSKFPPLAVAQFAERVPMVKGRWNPAASTATSYAWFIWLRDACVGTQLIWIPPGQRAQLTRADDVARFARGAA
jgi:hypothetical protein